MRESHGPQDGGLKFATKKLSHLFAQPSQVEVLCQYEGHFEDSLSSVHQNAS